MRKYKHKKDIKLLSLFFNNNISIHEKKNLKRKMYIAPKRYYWFNCVNYNEYICKYINFFILYYNIFEYDKLVDKLNISNVENNKIVSIEIPLKSSNIKHY